MKGKVPVVVPRVLAVVSAVAIGGGFVAWKNAEGEKARQRDHSERERAMEEIDSNWRNSYDSMNPMPPGDDANLPELEKEDEAGEQELLPSSKIGIFRLPAKEADPPKKKDPRLLPSSKSIDSILEEFVPENSE